MHKKIFKHLVKQAKKSFPAYQEIKLRVKKNPKNPFNSSIFRKIIEMRELHPEYLFYIHPNEDYVQYKSLSIQDFEPVQIPLDNKLWIELLFVFKVVQQ